jgi:hypothetical protein
MSISLRGIVPIMVIAALAARCAGNQPSDGAAVRPAQTSFPRGTEDPLVKPAVSAYQNFLKAIAEAQQKPVAQSRNYPAAADFTRYSFDPVAGEFEAAVRGLSVAKQHYQGDPPQSHLKVVAIDQDASPLPMVTLSDCQTGVEKWQVFDTQTGKVVPHQEPRIPSPYGATITVVYNEQRWGVNTITMDPQRTCPE